MPFPTFGCQWLISISLSAFHELVPIAGFPAINLTVAPLYPLVKPHSCVTHSAVCSAMLYLWELAGFLLHFCAGHPGEQL